MAKQQKRHVETYVGSMQRHIHIHKKPTTPNIEDVEKKAFATRNRSRETLRRQNSV